MGVDREGVINAYLVLIGSYKLDEGAVAALEFPQLTIMNELSFWTRLSRRHYLDA